MRFVDRLPVWLLLFVGIALAGANLRVTAARSTIPLALSAKVVEREIRHEKHPGQDDVFFLQLDDDRKLHVDEAVFKGVAEGDTIEKRRFDHHLEIHRPDGTSANLPLALSIDSRGMHVVMPVVLGLATVLAFMGRNGKRGHRKSN